MVTKATEDKAARGRKFGQDAQLSYRSTVEIVGKFKVAAAKLACEVRFNDQVLKAGHLANALAHWVGTMSDEDLVKHCAPLLRNLEKYTQGAGVILDDKPRSVQGKVVDEQQEEGRRRRRA